MNSRHSPSCSALKDWQYSSDFFNVKPGHPECLVSKVSGGSHKGNGTTVKSTVISLPKNDRQKTLVACSGIDPAILIVQHQAPKCYSLKSYSYQPFPSKSTPYDTLRKQGRRWEQLYPRDEEWMEQRSLYYNDKSGYQEQWFGKRK